MAQITQLICDFNGVSKEHPADFRVMVGFGNVPVNELPGADTNFDACGHHLTQMMNDRWHKGAQEIKVIRHTKEPINLNDGSVGEGGLCPECGVGPLKYVQAHRRREHGILVRPGHRSE